MTDLVKVILDTDIGPDCDDAGALGILNALVDSGEAEIVAVGHCTSSVWGAPCIDAINVYYGRPEIPIGTLITPGFLDEEKYASYNRAVAQTFPNRFVSSPQSVPDVIAVYRSVLSNAADKSITFVSIGPLPNLANLLDSRPDEICPLCGMDLVRSKVARLIVMGGSFPRIASSKPAIEWNFEMDPASAARVASSWPCPVYFTGVEVGAAILTGGKLVAKGSDENPVRECYCLYRHTDDKGRRMSWDLTAVHFAVRPESGLWRIEGPGTVTVGSRGESSWNGTKKGNHFLIQAAVDPAEIEEELDALLLKTPVR